KAAVLLLGLKLTSSLVRNDIERTIAELGRIPGSGLIVLSEPFANTQCPHRRTCSAISRTNYLSAGELVSYGLDLPDSFRSAAAYVDRIMRGEKPANLRVQSPSKFPVVVNLKLQGLPSPPWYLGTNGLRCLKISS